MQNKQNPRKYFPGTFPCFLLSKVTKTTYKEERIMKTIAIVILTIVVCATSAWAGGVGDAIEVRIVTDDGRTLPTYR